MSKLSAWLWLALAIGLEVSGTLCLKLSDGFSRWLPLIGAVVFYIAAFAAMVMALKRIEVGIVYAVWSGVGTALITIAGILLFDEAVTLMKLAAIALIIAGVVMLHLGQGA